MNGQEEIGAVPSRYQGPASLPQEFIASIRAKIAKALDQPVSGIRVLPGGKQTQAKFHIALVDYKTLEVYAFEQKGAMRGGFWLAIEKAFTSLFFSSDECAYTSDEVGKLAKQGMIEPVDGRSFKILDIGEQVLIHDDPIRPEYTTPIPEIKETRYKISDFQGCTAVGGCPLYLGNMLAAGLGVSGDTNENNRLMAKLIAQGYMRDIEPVPRSSHKEGHGYEHGYKPGYEPGYEPFYW